MQNIFSKKKKFFQEKFKYVEITFHALSTPLHALPRPLPNLSVKNIFTGFGITGNGKFFFTDYRFTVFIPSALQVSNLKYVFYTLYVLKYWKKTNNKFK